MPRTSKAPSFAKLRDQLELAMCGGYGTWSARADACLQTINRARNPEVQRRLWGHLLKNFRLLDRKVKDGKQPPGTGLSDELFSEVLGRVRELIAYVVRSLLARNQPLGPTVLQFISFMNTLANDDARRVALAVIFRSPLVPYVQIPRGLRKGACRVLGKKRFLRSSWRDIAIMYRLAQEGKRSRREQLAVLAKLVRRAPDELAAQSLIGFTMALWERNDAPDLTVASIPLGPLDAILGEAIRDLQGDLLRRLAGGGCGNPDCPVHGGGKRNKPVDKVN